MSRDNDVTMVLALNRISALFGIFFWKALRYVFDECLLLCEVSKKSMSQRNFDISWNFYKKVLNYACTEDWT